MPDPVETMIANLPERTGRALEEWLEILKAAQPAKHGEAMKVLKLDHGVSHGFANLIAIRYFEAQQGGKADNADLVDAQYAGAKAGLRSLSEALLQHALALGEGVEIAPKKTYVALRRSKQFGLIQPATRTRIDLGLNLPGAPTTDRLRSATGMCSHKVAIERPEDIDAELLGYLKQAYERA